MVLHLAQAALRHNEVELRSDVITVPSIVSQKSLFRTIREQAFLLNNRLPAFALHVPSISHL